MYFFVALLVLPLTLLVLWAASFAWLTDARRRRRLVTAELALCGAGALVAIVLISTTLPDDLVADATDFTPLWGGVLLFSSVLSCMMVGVLWALTAFLTVRRQRPQPDASGKARTVRSAVSRHPVLSAVAATVASFMLVIVPTLHIFDTNRDDLVPPNSVSAAVLAFRETLQNTPGMISSDVVAKRGGYDGDGSPDNASAWFITASVTAAPGTTAAHDTADTLRQGLATAGTVVRSFGVLTVTGDGSPDTIVEFDDQQDSRNVGTLIDTGLLLRTVPGVQAVAVSDSALPSITVASPSRWSETVRNLRALPGFGSDALPTVTVNTPARAGGGPLVNSVVVDRTVPDQVTLTGLVTIANQAGVVALVYDSTRPRVSPEGWRPTLTITTTTTATRNDVVEQLTAFDTQPALAVGTPRAIYTVNAETDEIGSGSTGYLGLPEGTPEPDDLARLPEPPNRNPGCRPGHDSHLRHSRHRRPGIQHDRRILEQSGIHQQRPRRPRRTPHRWTAETSRHHWRTCRNQHHRHLLLNIPSRRTVRTLSELPKHRVLLSLQTDIQLREASSWSFWLHE